MARIALFSSHDALDTGAPHCVLKIAERLHKQHDLTVVLPVAGEFAEALTARGIEHVVIPFRRLRRLRRGYALFRDSLGLVRASVQLWRWLRQSRIELVNFADAIDVPFLPTAGLSGAVVVTHLRCILESPLQRFLFRLVTSWSTDAVVCVSKATQRAMFGGPTGNSWVIYDPGPSQPFTDSVVPPPPMGETLRLIAIAKFVAAKGHPQLVSVVHELRERGIPVHCTIVGRDEPGHEACSKEFWAAVHRHGLQSQFTVIPYLPASQVAEAIDRSHVLVHLPVYQDPCPGVVQEAMARARVVVAYDSGGIREEFEDGVSGFLVPQGDQSAVVTRLAALAGDPDLCRRIGTAARECVLSRFSDAQTCDRLLALYEQLLSKRGKRHGAFTKEES